MVRGSLFLGLLTCWNFWISQAMAALDLEALAKVPSGMDVNLYDSDRTYDGYLVFCPEYDDQNMKTKHGPRIYHPSGALFWAGDEYRWRCLNAQLHEYNNGPVMTFWYQDAKGISPYGVILDSEYREAKKIHPVMGKNNFDLHEFHFTQNDRSVILIAMDIIEVDVTSVGGSVNGHAFSPFVQEVDVATNEVIWEWDASKYLGFAGSYRHYNPSWYDYAHCNAALKDNDGNWLMSFRFYSMIAKVNGKTKEIIWQLGGKESDFTFNNGSSFIGQHDPQWVPGTDYREMTLFDNDRDNCRAEGTYGTGRGIRIRLDYKTMSVSLVREYLPRKRERVEIEGGLQLLPNGNVLVAFGSNGWVNEYTHDGELLFEGWAKQVYRAYKYPKSFWPGEGLPDPNPKPESDSGGSDVTEMIAVSDEVSMVFSTGTQVATCGLFQSLFGLC